MEIEYVFFFKRGIINSNFVFKTLENTTRLKKCFMWGGRE